MLRICLANDIGLDYHQILTQSLFHVIRNLFAECRLANNRRHNQRIIYQFEHQPWL